MALGAPDDEERDIEHALGRISARLTDADLASIRELIPEHPALRRMLVAQTDLYRAAVLVANGLAEQPLVDFAFDAARAALADYATDAHITVAERAHADQVLAALRDHDADEVRRITRPPGETSS